MLPSTNDDIPFYPNIPARFSHIISYVDFSQENDNRIENDNQDDYPLASTILLQRLTRQQTQNPLHSPRLANSSLVASSSLLKDTTITFVNERKERKVESIPVDDDVKQSRTDSTPPAEIIETADREQQTSPLDMSLLEDEDENFSNLNNPTIITPRIPQQRSISNQRESRSNSIKRSSSNQRESRNNSIKRSSSEEHVSTIPVEEEQEVQSPHQIKSIVTQTVPVTNPMQPKPKLKYTTKLPSTSSTLNLAKNGKTSSLKWSSSLNTSRSMPVVPSISRRALQGVLVRFFRNGDEYHPGVKMAISEFNLKSWEAFLNYLNRQPRLALATGGIKHIYTINGQEIRSIDKFKHRQSYVVSSGNFIRTNYRYMNDSFGDETDSNVPQELPPYWNTRASVHQRWRSPLAVPYGEQIFLLPYSRLNMYESIILNRNSNLIFEEWLQDQVTDLLSQYNNHEDVTHLFAITKSSFIEIKSFSKLFSLIKLTDTFIGCTEDEYVHAKHYLGKMKPSELFLDQIWPRKAIGKEQRYPSKRAIEDTKINLNWIHGYDGENDLTKNLYTLPENEILYVIGSICILYDSNLKTQRFYIQHTNQITCVNIHQCQSLVASSEMGSLKSNQRALIHIWDHVKLQTIAEIRKEQFGSYIKLFAFSPKSDDNLLLLVSQDKPQLVLFLDWKRNELIYSITCKSDDILSVLFVFDTTEWIACLSQRHLLFYHINWNLRPLRMLERRESEVQNVYTGAAACDPSGDRFLVGDTIGNVHVWRLIDNEPELVVVQENIIENDVETIVPISQEAFVLANRENQIKVWNIKLNSIEQIRLNENVGPIRSICIIRRDSIATALAIGTKYNYIISKELESEQFDAIMRGHTSPSICLCCDKDSPNFFSISSDRHLFKWNNITRTVEWSAKLSQPISCADLHPERNIIVLGSETSKLLVYDTLSSYYITTITLKMNTGVKSVRFSPDGKHLAVGLQNGSVCVFDVLGNGEFHLRPDGILQNDTAAVSDTAWSNDSQYLLAIYSDNDHMIWDISSLDIIRAKTIHNIQWHQIVHPIMCSILDKTTALTHTSPVVLSPTLVLCCGKDGQLRLFRNRHEHHSQTFQLGLGPIQSLLPSTAPSTYLISLTNHPVIVEVQVNMNSHYYS